MRWGFKLSRTTGTTEQMIDERVRSAVAADAGSIEVPADEPGPAGADGGGALAMVALIVGIVGVVAMRRLHRRTPEQLTLARDQPRRPQGRPTGRPRQ